MYLQSISNLVPPQALTQETCWDIFKNSPTAKRLQPRSVSLVRKILKGDSGIDKRHFALDDLENLFELDAESLNRCFEHEAPKLARQALVKALHKAELKPQEINALFICTCTGYICPGVTSYVAEQTAMRRNTYLQDIVGLGCGAAIPTLRSASNFLSAYPEAKVAVIAVEICSAAFYMDDDPGVLISACLFGDGASASIWSNDRDKTGLHCNNFDLIHLPEDRDLLRFVNRLGKLCNKLHKTVPQKAAQAVNALYGKLNGTEISQVISHAGGRDVLEAIQNIIPEFKLKESAKILRQFGNMSSPSVLFALDEFLTNNTVKKNLWLTSFGAGFSCHSCLVSPP